MNPRTVYCLSVWSLLLILLSGTGCQKSSYRIQSPATESAKDECVVLLHGMARSYKSMSKMQNYLTASGFHTVNMAYPSTDKTIEEISRHYVPEAIKQCEQFKPRAIHFVSHSLGGIIIRCALKKGLPSKLGKVVMLSPPNQGSEVVDKLHNWWLYKWLNGPAGQQLSTAPASLPNMLGPVNYPVGIITGNQHTFFDGWLSKIIPGDDDGKVSVARAKVVGMTDFLVVPETHPFIMTSPLVFRQTLSFLERGYFDHQQ